MATARLPSVPFLMQPSSFRSMRSLRAMRRPFSIWKESSRSGSLMRPFQLDLARQRGEAAAVVERRRGVVNGARADHDEEPRGGAFQQRD